MACGCNVKGRKSASLEMSKLLTNPKTRSEVVRSDYISARDFENLDKFTLLKFAYCADQEAFKRAFDQYIEFPDDFDPQDLKVLAEMWEAEDTSQLNVEVEFSKIKVDKQKLANSNIKFV